MSCRSTSFRILLTAWLCLGLALAGAFPAVADSFPSRPIHLIVPYPPGGSADVMARLIAEAMSKSLGQNVVVDNRGGASGNIAAQLVAKSRPDGYTLMIANAPVLAINPTLYKEPGFDPIKDFQPVSLVSTVPLFLLVNPKAPFHSVGELVAWAKQHPGDLHYAAGSSGSTTALSMEMFLKAADAKGVQIAYKGSGPALIALMEGQVPVMFELMASAMPLVKDHRVDAIAVTTAERSEQFPKLPTVAESGFPGFEVSSWFGVVAPAGTPPEVVAKLDAAISAVVKSPEFKARMVSLGAVALSGGPTEFARLIKAELAKWKPVIKESGASIG
jgi:tripartite-type tricarboxylate transporter receptor subunit TctC